MVHAWCAVHITPLCGHTLCILMVCLCPYTVPEKVVNVTTRPDVSGMEATVWTHWIAPHSDVTISHYIIKYTFGGVEVNATSPREEAVQVVKKGTMYLVAVAAVSALGVGSFSDSTAGKSYDGGLVWNLCVVFLPETFIDDLCWCMQVCMYI